MASTPAGCRASPDAGLESNVYGSRVREHFMKPNASNYPTMSLQRHASLLNASNYPTTQYYITKSYLSAECIQLSNNAILHYKVIPLCRMHPIIQQSNITLQRHTSLPNASNYPTTQYYITKSYLSAECIQLSNNAILHYKVVPLCRMHPIIQQSNITLQSHTSLIST